MHTRGTAALSLGANPSVASYRDAAARLVRACAAGDDDLLAWASQLVAGAATRAAPERPHEEPHALVRDARAFLGFARTPATLAPDDAAAFVAWLHGFEGWSELAHHLDALADPASPVARFEAAAEAVIDGNLAALRRMLRDEPELIRRRSTRDHHGTLLHYTAANGHEGFRQRTPPNAVEVARLLLDAGAEPDALADMYGYRCTTMEMLVSSAHPHLAGLHAALVDALVDGGASPNGAHDEGSPLMTALRFQYPAAAEALVRRGARIDNVVAAAALGRVDLVDRFVGADGTLAPEAMRVPGPWPRLSDDPKQHLGYALTWACSFGRPAVVELLLRKGVDPAGHDDDAGAIHFAAAYGRMDLVRQLVAHGASLEQLNSYGGTVLSGTLWFADNAPVPGVDYAAVVRELLAMGARDHFYPGLRERVDRVLARQLAGGEERA